MATDTREVTAYQEMVSEFREAIKETSKLHRRWHEPEPDAKSV
jgi:hypothetical protein